MFVGRYEHTLDGKGRVVLPAKFRNHLAERAYLAPGGNCLALWLPEAFDAAVARLRTQVREGTADPNALRGLLANSDEVTPDSQGRILVNDRLRAFASLDRDVVLAGQDDHIEIWDARRWQSLETDIDASVAEAFLQGRAV